MQLWVRFCRPKSSSTKFSLCYNCFHWSNCAQYFWHFVTFMWNSEPLTIYFGAWICSIQLYYCRRLILYQGEKDHFLRTTSFRVTKFQFFNYFFSLLSLFKNITIKKFPKDLNSWVCRSDLRLKRHKMKSRVALK